jgi:hypothetical protein
MRTDTEIDWKAYMQQIAIFNKGERDYKNIEGDTGPLVYPGAHVLIYRILYWITDQGKNIQLAQYIFGLLYLSTLAVVIQCYRKARVRFPSSYLSGWGDVLMRGLGPAICVPTVDAIEAIA